MARHTGANLHLRIKPNLKKMLQEGANNLGITVSEYVEEMLVDEFLPPKIVTTEQYELDKEPSFA